MLTVAIPIPVPEEEPLPQATIPTPASDKLAMKRRRAQNLFVIVRSAARFLRKSRLQLVFFLTNYGERTRAHYQESPNLQSQTKTPAKKKRWINTEKDYTPKTTVFARKFTAIKL